MGSIQQEDITFIIIHVLNIGVPKYIKKILIEIKGEMYSNTVIEDLIPHLLQWIDHLDSKLVKDIFGKMYLIDLDHFIQQQQNTHSFQVYGIFLKTDHILCQKTSLNKCKKIGIISSIFLDHSGMKLEVK